MTESAKEARRAYYRQWRKNNPEKSGEYQKRYWDRKALQLEATEKEKGESRL